jgi:hypothetical protein
MSRNTWLTWNLCFLDASFERDCGLHVRRTQAPQTSFYGASKGYCVLKLSTHTLQELQANIQRTVDRISTDTLQNVFLT